MSITPTSTHTPTSDPTTDLVNSLKSLTLETSQQPAKESKINVIDPGFIIRRLPNDKVVTAFCYGNQVTMTFPAHFPREVVFSRKSWMDVFTEGKRGSYDILCIKHGDDKSGESISTFLNGFDVERLLKVSFPQ